MTKTQDKETPIIDLIEQFQAGKLKPAFSYADLPLGDYAAEITKIYADTNRGCITVTYHIESYGIDISQLYFTEKSDNECLKFFDFLKSVGVQEIKPEYLTQPIKSKVIGKQCLIAVNVSGSQGRVFKNALFIRLSS